MQNDQNVTPSNHRKTQSDYKRCKMTTCSVNLDNNLSLLTVIELCWQLLKQLWGSEAWNIMRLLNLSATRPRTQVLLKRGQQHTPHVCTGAFVKMLKLSLNPQTDVWTKMSSLLGSKTQTDPHKCTQSSHRNTHRHIVWGFGFVRGRLLYFVCSDKRRINPRTLRWHPHFLLFRWPHTSPLKRRWAARIL